VAGEIAQALDELQVSNCQKIEQIPKDSPERIKLIYLAVESERQLVQLALLTKMLAISPNSERLQRAIVDWVASSAKRADELSARQPSAGLTRRSGTKFQSKIEEALRAEPRLRSAMRRESPFDLSEILDA